MPRPKKCRRICGLPQTGVFGPLAPFREPVSPASPEKCGSASQTGEAPQHSQRKSVSMTLDEYEAIRLIDLLGLTQEDCAMQMGVARTTVQAIYNTARTKLAGALVYGLILCISGGDYVLCHNTDHCCGKNCSGRKTEGGSCCEQASFCCNPCSCNDKNKTKYKEESPYENRGHL